MSRDLPAATDEREALELLPWYVNGTLAGDEQEFVRQALRTNLTLRIEHDRLVRVRDLMREDDAEHAATGRSFERLMSRIQRRHFWQRPAFWPAAAAIVVAVTGPALWWDSARQEPPGGFVTLTSQEPGASARQLRVVFAAGVTDEARRALLAAHGLTETAPPTAAGVYTLAPPTSADARAIAAALRADPRVAFASTPPAGEQR